MNYKSITRNSRIHFAAILFIYDSKTFAQPCQVAGPGPGLENSGPGPEVRVQGPQKVARPDLDRTLDSLRTCVWWVETGDGGKNIPQTRKGSLGYTFFLFYQACCSSGVRCGWWSELAAGGGWDVCEVGGGRNVVVG